MMGFFKSVFGKFFGKKSVKAQDIIVVDKKETAIPVPTPTFAVRDTIDSGSTRSPDFSFLFDNCFVQETPELKKVLANIKANSARYKKIETTLGVPWELIAALHYRESGCDFNTYLGNGEPLSRKTKLVPKGRGPFKTWEEGAVDALVYDGLDKIVMNTPAQMCLWAEKFNGLGYRNKGIYSPYVWAGTSMYNRGKYTSDGIYNPFKKDAQLGVAAIIKALKNA